MSFPARARRARDPAEELPTNRHTGRDSGYRVTGSGRPRAAGGVPARPPARMCRAGRNVPATEQEDP